jgi:hypothetical protein
MQDQIPMINNVKIADIKAHEPLIINMIYVQDTFHGDNVEFDPTSVCIVVNSYTAEYQSTNYYDCTEQILRLNHYNVFDSEQLISNAITNIVHIFERFKSELHMYEQVNTGTE